MTAYTEAQMKAIAIIPKITSSVSIACSLVIVWETILDFRKNRSRAIQCALGAMSVFDILASSGWFLSTWAVPRGSAVYAVGNTQSCTYQGFLLQIAIGAPMYNASLALYYLLTIRNGWQEHDLKRIEPWVNAFVITFAVSTSIALIPLNSYNHIGAVCWVMGLPQGCGYSNYSSGDEPCERGEHAWIYGLALFYILLWICILFTSVAMALIYYKVHETEKRNLRYAGARNQARRVTFFRSNRIVTQASFYTAAFYVTWAPSTIWSIAHWFGRAMFWLDLLATICEPSQGSLNFFVYIRTRPAIRDRLKLQLCCCWFHENDEHEEGTSSYLSRFDRPSSTYYPSQLKRKEIKGGHNSTSHTGTTRMLTGRQDHEESENGNECYSCKSDSCDCENDESLEKDEEEKVEEQEAHATTNGQGSFGL